MIREEAIELIKKHGSMRAAARAIGRCHQVLSRAISGRNGHGVRTPALAGAGRRASKEVAQPGRTLADFKRLYDKDVIVPNKLQQALQKLSGEWRYEHEFARMAGVSSADMQTYRHLFDNHHVALKREHKLIWCGTVALANKLREIT